MKSHLSILALLLGTTLVPVLANEDVKNKTVEDIPSPETRSVNTVPELILRNSISNTNVCGGALTSSSATISYKNGASISPNERRGAPAPSSISITRAGSVSLPTTCHSLVITFYSGASVGSSRGFSLSYSMRSGTTGAATASKSYILNGDHQQIRHPANADLEYTHWELTMFGFAPRSNVYTSSRKTLVTYMRDTMEGGCFEEIKLFRFDRE
ncbi:hypothetical protein Ocin01_14898 [Orchesella cincta]|uniref:CUB domain-containing protein n=1 Tax=Orchesella cincta TaxID=48709 RepID=A0A1D2MFM5_ORCCI|nr:hypothetical protein Ocin01_14898 [Orchesella cincta]